MTTNEDKPELCSKVWVVGEADILYMVSGVLMLTLIPAYVTRAKEYSVCIFTAPSQIATTLLWKKNVLFYKFCSALYLARALESGRHKWQALPLTM
jgi:hypothetical protein